MTENKKILVNLQPKEEINHKMYDAEWAKIGKNVDNIYLIHDFVLPKNLKKMYEYINQFKDDKNFYGGNDKRKFDVLKDNPEIHSLMEHYEQLIYDKCVEFYTDKLGVKLRRLPINDLHFVRWPIGMSSGLHADCERPDGQPAYHAKFYRLNISCLLYLNDNYGGGELDFPSYNFKFKPKAGDLAIFPSNHRHLITEVTGDNRYTMPIWFTFDLPDIFDQGRDFDAESSIILWKNDGEFYERSEVI